MKKVMAMLMTMLLVLGCIGGMLAEEDSAPATEPVVVAETVVEDTAAQAPAESAEAAPAAQEATEAAPAAEAPAAEEAVEAAPAEAEPTETEPAAEEVAEPAEAEPVAEEAAETAEAEPVAEEAAETAEAEPVAEEAAETAEAEPAAEEVTEPAEAESAAEEATEPVQEEAEATEAEEAPAAAEAAAFAGSLSARVLNEGDIFEGDAVTLKATVLDANLTYSLTWQTKVINDEYAEWISVLEGETYTFTASKACEGLYYRAVLTAEDGTVLTSKLITLRVLDKAVEEPAEEAPEAEQAEEAEVEIIEDYETPLGLDDGEETAYAFERGEDGELILDEAGNPVASAIGEGEIPVAYQRGENGELMLDENGDPIPTYTVPTDAVKMVTLEDVLDPNRSIDIYLSWNNEEPVMGGNVTLISVLNGYDNLVYTVQWQQSPDDATWYNIDTADQENPLRYSFTVTEDNYQDFWRVEVVITGFVEE